VNGPGLALLRFRAGEVLLGVAAGTARGFSRPRRGLIHVGELLGIDVTSSAEGRRTLEVYGLAGEARLLVDGPVGLHTIGPADILARPVGLPLGTSPLVVGFASGGAGKIVMLIDVERLIAVAQDRAVTAGIAEGRGS
jgi:hypothetical protein